MTQQQERNQVIGGAIALVLFAFGLMWLISTNKPPVLDTPVKDPQIHFERSNELPKFWNKYAEGVYNRSNEKN